jgi:hypothetical protein
MKTDEAAACEQTGLSIAVVEWAELGVGQAVEVSGGKESGPHQDSLMIRRTWGGTGVIII